MRFRFLDRKFSKYYFIHPNNILKQSLVLDLKRLENPKRIRNGIDWLNSYLRKRKASISLFID